jgi:hypothetical protein
VSVSYVWKKTIQEFTHSNDVPSDAASLNAIQCSIGTRHKLHVFEIKATGQNLRHSIRSARSLQRQQLHRIFQILHGDISRKSVELLLKMLHIPKFGGAIDNHVHKVSGVGNDSVINDPTSLISDERETPTTVCQASNIANDNLFQKGNAVLSVPTDLKRKNSKE